jgi:hypothetical protein
VERAILRDGVLVKIERRKGWPDRLLMVPRSYGPAYVWIEMKRSKKDRPEKLQAYIHEFLRGKGCQVRVIYTRKQFDDLLSQMGAAPVPGPRREIPARARRRRVVARPGPGQD